MSTSDETQQWLLQAKSDLLSALQPYNKSTCIFSAPKELLKEYEDAYVPRIVSIGPYHFGKEELREMERFKSEAVRRELVRIQSITGNFDFSFEQVIDKIFGMVNQILRCYDKEIPYSAEVVCWMMVRDACFILEFFRCYIWQVEEADPLVAENEGFQFRDKLHPIFGLNSENHVVKSEIMRDLIKLENQIPLFVLEVVLAMEEGVALNVSVSTKDLVATVEASCIEKLKKVMDEASSMEEASCIERLKKVMEEAASMKATSCIETIKKVMEEASTIEGLERLKEEAAFCIELLKKVMEDASYNERLEKAKSKLQILLNAVFDKIYYRPFEYCADDQSPRQNHIDIQDSADEQSLRQNHILDIYYYYCLGDGKYSNDPEVKKHVHTICFRNDKDSEELEEKRKRSKFPSAVELNNGGVKIQAKGKKVEDVRFKGRTLSIPRIKFDVDSEIYIRNLIALEICSPYGHPKRMTAFAQFMNDLCQTEKGTAVMREKGVIVGNLWQHSAVTRFFSSCKQSPLLRKPDSIERTRRKLMKYSNRTCWVSSAKVWNEFGNAYFLKPWLLIGGIGAIIVLLLTAVQVLCLFRSCGARFND